MDTHTIIEQLLKAVFSMQSVPKLYNENQQGKLVSCETVTSW
jgi:hypothetical protein